MRILVASEAHFDCSPEGFVYSRGPENYSFWAGYLSAFSQVGVLARVSKQCRGKPQAERSSSLANGPAVRFHALEDY